MKRLLLLLLTFGALISASANVVTVDQALVMAHGFINQGDVRFNATPGSVLKLAHQANSLEGKPDYYVFNNGDNGGFVVVTGDDRTVPVWGYSTSGSFDYESMPDNVKWWFSEYQRQMQYLRDNPRTHSRQAVMLSRRVDALIKTKWDQCAPYNFFCPSAIDKYHHYVNPETGFLRYYADRSCTGCVATALAQIMNYHKWPAIGLGSTEYSSIIKEYKERDSDEEQNRSVILSADFSSSIYEWELMKEMYRTSENEYGLKYEYFENGKWVHDNAPCFAVALLMSDVGKAVQTRYGAGSIGSSANSDGITEETAMKLYFRYHATNHCRDEYETIYQTNDSWDIMLRRELDAGHPIFYGATKPNDNGKDSGHAFVVDGYDKEGRFWINWGWGGDGNGCFFSTLLEPDAGYSHSHKAVFLELNKTAKALSVNLLSEKFSTVNTNTQATKSMRVIGMNLDHDVTITLSGQDAGQFSVPTIVSASAANASNGTIVKVVYNPKECGEHKAQLTLSAGPDVEPLSFTLKG